MSFIASRGIISGKVYTLIFFPLDGIAHWNRWYGKHGFHQCQLVLPHDTAAHGLARIVQLVRDSSHVVPLAVIKRLGERSSGGLLSFPMAGMTLAMDIKHHRHCPESVSRTGSHHP